MIDETMPLLRLVNLGLTLLCVLVIAAWNGRRPGRWALMFPIIFWLLHMAAFYGWLLICCTWPAEPPSAWHTLWSSVIRMQLLFTILIVGLIALARRRDV